MAIKWKSRPVGFTLLACTFLFWALILLNAANLYVNRDYIGNNSYFSSAAFSREMFTMYSLIEQNHMEASNFELKSPEQQLKDDKYAELQNEADAAIQDKLNAVEQKYDQRIGEAQNKNENDEVDRLEAEKEAKLADVHQEGNAILQQSVKKAIADKRQQLAEAKTALESRKDSVYYVIRNLKTGEIYENVDAVKLDSLNQTKGILYALNLPEPNIAINLRGLSMQFDADQLQGTLYIANPDRSNGKVQADYLSHSAMKKKLVKQMYLLLVCLIAAIALTVLTRAKQAVIVALADSQATTVVKRIPLDIRGWITILAAVILLSILMGSDIFYVAPTLVSLSQLFIVAISTILVGIVLYGLRDAFRLLREPSELAQQWRQSLAASAWNTFREGLAQRSIWFKLIVFVSLTAILGILPLMVLATDSNSDSFVIFFTSCYYVLYLCVVLPYVQRKVLQLRAIIKGVEALASGDFTVTLPLKGKGQLSLLASNINNMKQGLQLALEKQRVNDRLKTELITNVSHDLKTPLTSIVNYVDLLKKEGLHAEQAPHYLDVVERKTQRLKVLIEDLFEASKMASGAAELYWEKVDVAALLNQALGEFSDKIEVSGLTFRVNMEKPHYYAWLDGKKTWRVFENLIGNALKYAMPGTRVYIQLTETDERVLMTIQNISLHEFNFDASELFERFKRGDESRHTEGSGLGLAIAKSIVELQGGSLTIEIDGDQFKVMTEFMKREGDAGK